MHDSTFAIDHAANQEHARPESWFALTSFALDQVHEAAFLMDDDGRFLYVNQQACRSLGYDRDELIGMSIPDIDPDFTPERMQGRLRRLIEHRMQTIESRHRSRDGRIFPIEVTTSLFEYGGTRYALGLVRDITERKRLELSLQASEEHYRSLAENSPDHIMRFDRQARVIYMNPRQERALGVRLADVAGRVLELADPRFDEARHQLAQVLQTGRDAQFEVEMPDVGDGARYHLVSIVAERDQQGQVTGTVTIGRDITMRKQMEDTLRFIAQRGWMGNAESFFVALARYLGERLSVDYAFISRLDAEPAFAETVAFYARGGIQPNSRYELKGTPCENVIGKELCFYRQGVQELFPDDTLLVEMEVEGYAGTPLWDTTGRPIGLIGVMDGRPLANEAAIRQMLQLMAASATAALIAGRDEEALKDKQRRLNAMTLELSMTEERERRAIATELHDGIGQDLTLARIKLGVLAKEALDGKSAVVVDGIRDILDGVIRNVRMLTHRISPPILDSGSLEMALKCLARQVEEDYGLKVLFRDDRSEKSLSRDIGVEIYNAVRELLLNAAKHAGTDTVRVEVCRLEDDLIIRVEDQGRGFDPVLAEQRLIEGTGGFGLFNIRRRIDYLGGVFEIDSHIGGGCRVSIRMPLDEGRAGEER